MDEFVRASIPVIGAMLLAGGGGLLKLSRQVSSLEAEMRDLRQDVRTMDQRIFEMIRSQMATTKS